MTKAFLLHAFMTIQYSVTFLKDLISDLFCYFDICHVRSSCSSQNSLRHHFEGFKPRHKRPYSTSLLTLSTQGPYFRAISLQLDFLEKERSDNLNFYVKFQHRLNIWSAVSLKVDMAPINNLLVSSKDTRNLATHSLGTLLVLYDKNILWKTFSKFLEFLARSGVGPGHRRLGNAKLEPRVAEFCIYIRSRLPDLTKDRENISRI